MGRISNIAVLLAVLMLGAACAPSPEASVNPLGDIPFDSAQIVLPARLGPFGRARYASPTRDTAFVVYSFGQSAGALLIERPNISGTLADGIQDPDIAPFFQRQIMKAESVLTRGGPVANKFPPPTECSYAGINWLCSRTETTETSGKVVLAAQIARVHKGHFIVAFMTADSADRAQYVNDYFTEIARLLAVGKAAVSTVPAVAAGKSPTVALRDEVLAVTLAEARARLSDRTRTVYDSGHGTQVNYTSADGGSNLWYPGNAVILRGQWKIEERPFRGLADGRPVTQTCFRYGPNTYNPVTRESGDGWSCVPSAFARLNDRESASGDILQLAGRTGVPFVLGRDPITLEALKARVAGR